MRESFGNIFDRATTLRGEERARYLRAACGSDDRLRAELERLLAAHDSAAKLPEQHPQPLAAGPLAIPPHERASTPLPRLERYVDLEKVGEGGMGEVYRARDSRLPRTVALKFLPSELARDAYSLDRFKREAFALVSLDHPNIARLFDLVDEGERPFLVMEFVEGETLQNRLRRGAIPLAESLRLGIQVADALSAAHEKRIIHRDLKPANVMIRTDGVIKIVDFGIAKALADVSSSREERSSGVPDNQWSRDSPATQSPSLSSAAGSIGYMSPEQLRAEQPVPQTDIWALGCVLYECMTSRRAFRRDPVRESPPKAVRLHSNSVNPEASRATNALLGKCLSLAVADRPTSMEQVKKELRRIEVMLAAPAAPNRNANSEMPPDSGMTDENIGSARGTESRYARRWGALLLFLILALIGSLVAWNCSAKRFPLGPMGALEDQLVDARSIGNAVQVKYASGRVRLFVAPRGTTSWITKACLTSTAEGAPQFVAALASAADDTRRHESMLLVWKANGEWTDSIRTGAVSSILSKEDHLSPSDGRGRLAELRPIALEGHALFVREIADYFPSSATFLRIDTDGKLERVKRIEHAGHIHAVATAPGFDPDQTVVWTTGMTRNSGPIRAAAHGVEGNTFFISCVDAESPAAQVFPVFDPDERAEAGGVRPAPPLLYFVYRGFTLSDEKIDWVDADSVTIANAWGERGRSGVLLSNNLRLEANWCSHDTIRVTLALSGRVLQVLEKRRTSSPLAEIDPVQRFLADSVVCLAYAPPGVTVLGPFRDIRSKLPAWIGP